MIGDLVTRYRPTFDMRRHAGEGQYEILAAKGDRCWIKEQHTHACGILVRVDEIGPCRGRSCQVEERIGRYEAAVNLEAPAEQFKCSPPLFFEAAVNP